MRIVIKIAGALMESESLVRKMARQIADMARDGHELLVIHGGGKIFTSTLARMGIDSQFVNGLRVTDRETRDAAVMVFAGLLNKRLAGAISLAGGPANQAPPGRHLAGGPARGGPCAERAILAAGRANAGRRAPQRAWVCRLRQRSECRISGFALADENGSGRALPGPRRGWRALQHQRGSHGCGRRRIYRGGPPHLCDRRGWCPGWAKSSAQCLCG